jgi:hypothetical protein
MKFSRQWLNDYVDLSDLSDDQLGVRLTLASRLASALPVRLL